GCHKKKTLSGTRGLFIGTIKAFDERLSVSITSIVIVPTLTSSAGDNWAASRFELRIRIAAGRPFRRICEVVEKFFPYTVNHMFGVLPIVDCGSTYSITG